MGSLLTKLFGNLWKSITEALFTSSHSVELAQAQARIKELEGQATAAQEREKALQAQVDKLNVQIAVGEAAVKARDVTIASLQTQIDALSAKEKEITDATKASVDSVSSLSDDAIAGDLAGAVGPKPGH